MIKDYPGFTEKQKPRLSENPNVEEQEAFEDAIWHYYMERIQQEEGRLLLELAEELNSIPLTKADIERRERNLALVLNYMADHQGGKEGQE